MESIKNALGYGSQSGQEPLSGETGKGTPDQPYDSGNVPGQSGASASEVTSTNPTGTTQYDTGENPNTSAVQDETRDNTKTNTSETLAAGVTGGDSNVRADDPANSQPTASTSGAVSKGTDEGQGADEQVTSNQSGPGSDSNITAQATFFSKAGIAKDKPAAPPKVPEEIENKDPFSSSSGGAASSNPPNESSNNNAQAPPSSSTTSNPSLDKIGSPAPEKGYKTADTEPHPQSSEVLSSSTPGAALDSPHQHHSTAQQQPSSITSASGTTAAAADTDYPSPKTQPSEAQGGLSGLSHNTGNAPSAPDTGSDAVEDPSLGASQGQGKKKMGERIKEKLHIGKKSGE
ncbi:MAG: hypothetical protein Q9225_004515 [Loekoesia sp. 1 TL-2023]